MFDQSKYPERFPAQSMSTDLSVFDVADMAWDLRRAQAAELGMVFPDLLDLPDSMVFAHLDVVYSVAAGDARDISSLLCHGGIPCKPSDEARISAAGLLVMVDCLLGRIDLGTYVPSAQANAQNYPVQQTMNAQQAKT